MQPQVPFALKYDVCFDNVMRTKSNSRSRSYDRNVDLQISELMSNKEEWIKLMEQQMWLHPLLILLLVTLLCINLVFIGLCINQYVSCNQGIERIKVGIRIAKNSFEISQANSVMLMDGTLFTMINAYSLLLV
jgi:hypothetical protein